jgi:filamentous hemagglutinin family protein
MINQQMLGPLWGATTAAVLFGSLPANSAELPVPCSPCTIAGIPPLGWVNTGSVATMGGDATHMLVTAGDALHPNAVLNWQSFNVSSGNAVQFVQPSATAIALNRIFQNDPSRIYGSLSANGQVYLINQNGILFGNPDGTPMQLNVQGLIATTLPINDQAIAGGILLPVQNGQAAFSGSGSGAIQVNSGATLTAADGGRIALFAPSIQNAGHIDTPNGQALLAAGQDIYLQSSDDPNLRGLLVEVDRGGTVSNTGSILAKEGNITLMGLAVNQQGRVTATTSVTKGGSVQLLARDTAAITVQSSGRRVLSASHTGAVELGAGSVTEVALASDGATAIDDQPQPVSAVTVDGKTIHLASGSSIVAHGGTVQLKAELDPSLVGTATQPANAAAYVLLDAGSSIDVSGGTVDVPMSRNEVSVQLRGNELRDDPLQRDGVLRGETVTIDARVGTPLADVSGYVAAAARRDVTERLGNGGAVTITSVGDATVSAGALVNIAGGAVNYLPGFISTTKLIGANGQVYDIGTAPANVVYTGLYSPGSTLPNKWGTSVSYSSLLGPSFQPGYVQGLNAGSVQISGRTLTVAGSLLARTQVGPYQTTAATQALPGLLTIGLPTGKSSLGFTDFLTPSLWLSATATTGRPAGAAVIDLAGLNAGGIGRFSLNSNGTITLPAGSPLQLVPRTQLSLAAAAIDINASITDAAGTFTASSVDIDTAVRTSSASRLAVASGVTFDLAGRWSNDYNTSSAPAALYLTGGRLDLLSSAIGGALALGDQVTIDVQGGGGVNAAGSLLSGNGGSIAIASTGQSSTMDLGAGLALRGYGLAGGTGGALSITAPSLTLAAVTARSGPIEDLMLGAAQHVAANYPLLIGADAFQQGGFTRYTLTANQGSLLVQPGANASLVVANRQLGSDYLLRPTGSRIADFSSVAVAPDYQRQTGSITLQMNLLSTLFTGQLRVGTGATLRTDPKGAITLRTSGGSLYLDGSVVSPSGIVSVVANQFSTQYFDPAFALWLGPNALLDVSGAVLRLPGSSNQTELQVLNAGKVSVTTSGYLVAEPYARIAADGAAASGDLQTVGFVQHLYDRSGGNHKTLGSSGGLISLSAAEGIIFQGGIDGRAGAPDNAAGELDITLARSLRTGALADSNSGFPNLPAQLLLSQFTRPYTGPALAFGMSFPLAMFNGKAELSSQFLADSHIDALNLSVGQLNIDNSNPVSLALARSLVINSAAIVGQSNRAVFLQAPSVSLQSGSRTAATPAAGLGTFLVNANNIDLVGGVAFSGFASTSLVSSGDIRLRGAPDQGALATSGALTLQANRIYPATMTSFTLAANDTVAAPGSITIQSNGVAIPASDNLLTAGGSIILNAADIVQNGVLEAPLGSITLNARNTLTLGAGSLTSVHASAGQILLGETINLGDWYYAYGGSTVLGTGDQIFGATRQAFPGKTISLNARSLTVNSGATVDFSGGGDALAWEQIVGPGGSIDALSVANAGGMFAILPQSSTGYGPVDPAEYVQWGLAPGAAVTLYQAAGGLAAGTYAILPPRYALLPGAFLVKPVGGYANMDPAASVAQADGSVVVAGASTFLNTGLQTNAVSGYSVRPGNYANQLAEYHLTSANAYLPGRAAELAIAAPRLPTDAGRLAITGQGALLLNGTFNGQSAGNGLQSLIDLSALNLAIVNAINPGSAATQVTAANLASIGAGSLLIGGTRTLSSAGTTVTVQASAVTIGDGVKLSVPELLVVGQNSVTVGADAQLATPASSSAPGPTYFVSGDSARLLLSSSRGAQLVVTYPPGAVPGQRGTVTTSAGSLISTQGSLLLDGARDLILGGGIAAASGATLGLSSSSVTLGDGAVVGTPGLILNTAELAKLANVDLTLKGRNGISVISPLLLSTNNLVLDSPTLRGVLPGTGAAATLAASNNLVLRNSTGTVATLPTGTLGGTLTLSGASVTFDSGPLALAGFTTTQIDATVSFTGRGTASLDYQGNLNATTPLLTLADGANLAVRAATTGATFRLDAPVLANGAAAPDSATLGGSLSITAGSIGQFGNIVLHSGSVVLDGSAGVVMGTGSRSNASGIDVTMPGLVTATPGGSLIVRSSTGDVTVQVGAVLDVSGSAGGGDAGSVSLTSTAGQANVDALAVLTGGVHGANAQAGSFALDAATLGGRNFTALNGQLNAGGFNGYRSFRLSGAVPLVELAVGTDLSLRGLQLVAEQGAITIGSHVTVSNPSGLAQLGLYARDAIHVTATGSLAASSLATGTTEAEIDLYTQSGSVAVDAGASLKASAPNSSLSTGGGLVHYRLSRDAIAANGLQVAANTVAAGTRQLVEGYKSYTLADGIIDTEVNAIASNTVYQDAIAFMNSAPARALGARGMTVEPGVELRSAGAMFIEAPWDLSLWRFGGRPGVLTLRAGGSLTVDQSLSDGFDGSNPDAMLRNDASWSLNLVAGANLGSVAPLATNLQATTANFSVSPDALVRTGTGDLSVAAAGSVQLLGTVTLDDPYGQGVVYTAGRSAELELDTLTNPGFATKFLPVDGGRLNIAAGQDIIGTPSDSDPTQLYVEWYRRQPTQDTESAGMWVNYDAFQQNFATFGGGDLGLHAGRDVVRVAASVPTTAYVDAAGLTRTLGSGSLDVSAGRNIGSGLFLVSGGTGRITAGGSLTGTRRAPGSSAGLGTVLAAMDSQYYVRARGDVLLNSVFNPTILNEVNQLDQEAAYFLSYSSNASVALTSTNGSITLQNNGAAAVRADVSGQLNLASPKDVSVMPGSFSARALRGDINVNGGMYLAPSPTGNLQLAAWRNLKATSAEISISDISSAALPTLTNPDLYGTGFLSQISLTLSGASAHSPTPLHAADGAVAQVIAATGDLTGGFWFLNRPGLVVAGRDLTDLRLNAENIATTDVTRVVAGRDIRFGSGSVNFGVNVDGPGTLQVTAGRNIDLGPSFGISTEGNLVNSGLINDGAGITVMAGIAHDIDSSLALIPTGAEVATLFNALRTAGRAAAAGTGNFDPGFSAIETLFPAAQAGGDKGNLSMVQSRIYTLDGGDINIVLPHGSVNVGVAQAASGGASKSASQLGIVAQKSGSVRAFVDGDFLVNSSRVFTLGGGDILIWSSNGNIDAGRGAKTTISAPEPTITIDAQGNVLQNFGAAIAGSGIRGILAVPNVAPGDVDLYAPRGFVSAGDAGIGSAGNVTIAAVRVIGADNINFGGTAVGVPVDTGGLGASLASVSAASSSATNSASEAGNSGGGEQGKTPLAAEALSWLEVFVLGLGEDNCRPDDLDCLKKQKKALN